MGRRFWTCVLAVVVGSAAIAADGRIKQYGRAIVEYRADDLVAVASYEYAQKHHDTPWLLIEFAVQAMNPVVIHRRQLTLVGPDELHELSQLEKAVGVKLEFTHHV